VDVPSLTPEPGWTAQHDHLVEFYETESFLVDTVCGFLAPALAAGDAAIVVATPVHQDMFETALGRAGIDLDAARTEGRYLRFDATTLLARFMVDGEPDPIRFRDAIGAALDRAGEGGRRVHVYGEMVALLWEDGNAASTLSLEDLWNDLAVTHRFTLLCAYPMRAFHDESSTAAFKQICDQHTMVIPSESYSLLADPAERSRLVAQLQQQAIALRPEVLRLRAQVGGHAGDRRDRAGERRDQAGGHRDEAGARRDRAGRQRDEAGEHRDQEAERRDTAAERRDDEAERRDVAAERSEASANTRAAADPPTRSALARREAASDRRQASQDRRAGATERVHAEYDRGTALADRGAGASERTHAELDRDTALSDRGASARDREHSSHDHLTGAYQRGAGFVELEREIARARRTGAPLVVAFIDVDGLKAINDAGGHAAGDRMLVAVVNCIRATLRSYDLIMRYGGDEFVCAAGGLDMAEGTKRLTLVNHALARVPEPGSVTVGLAELQADDSPEGLVARADAELYCLRRHRPPTPSCRSRH
jgi:diguanylate cyclase (GGDEF)-like protein